MKDSMFDYRTNWYAIKVFDYELINSELLEHLSMNGYTYDTNCEDVLFICEDESDYLETILKDRKIKYEIL